MPANDHRVDPSEIEVCVLDDDGVEAFVGNALEQAGCDWEELQAQASAGRFSSEEARKAWFVVSTFAEPSPA